MNKLICNCGKIARKPRWRAILVIFLLLSGPFFFRGAPASGQPGVPEYGDRIAIGMLGEPGNLLPFISSDAGSHEIASWLYVSLLKYDKDINIVPYAAESYEILDGGLRLRFTLKKGIRWYDGRELTVDDVEFTYKVMTDPATPTPYGSDFKQIKEFRKLDKYSFEVTYEKPFARALISWMTDIMPKHALEGQDLRSGPQTRNPMGCGPFRLTGWKPGALLTLKANPDYFEGRPYLDGIMYSIIPDNSTMFLELKAGNLDMMSLSPQQYLYQSKGRDFKDKFEVYPTLSFAYTFLGYNLKSALFSDVRVRRAFALAIDKNDVVKGAILGQGVPTIGPYKPGTWAYNNQIKDYPHDPAAARALLAECGWTRAGKDGILINDKGARFSFTILTNQGNEQRIKAATVIQSDLREIGVEANIRTVEWAVFIKEFVDKGFFDAVILGWSITQDPDPYDVWHSERAGVPGGLNFINYKNAEVDRLIDEARSTLDQDKRKVLYDRFQEILHDEQPYCFLYVPYSLPAVQRRFRGIEPAPAGITYNFIRWWVPKTEQLYRAQLQP